MATATARSSKRPRFREVGGLILVLLGLLTSGALWSYDARDATWFYRQPAGLAVANWFGRLGGTLAEALLQVFGTAGFFVPLLLVGSGIRRLARVPRSAGWAWFGALATLMLLLSAMLQLIFEPIMWGGERFRAGGFLGLRLAEALAALLNTPGAIFVCAATILVVVIMTTRLPVAASALAVGGLGARAGSLVRRRGTAAFETMRDRWAERRARSDAAPAPADARKGLLRSAIAVEPAEPPAVNAATNGAEPKLPQPPGRPKPPVRERERPRPAGDGRERQAALPLEPSGRGYSIPPIELLNEGEPQTIESEDELLERARLMTEKLREFQVLGQVVAVHPGPVVTTFEFRPDSGVKYSRITGMTEDLSLALKAESVRIDRLPGRSTVGIEVPNRRQETIFPRELIASERFRGSPSRLTMVLGKAINGEVFTAELDRMPHLLIAGATGSGKSVGLNCMIASMLFKATPEHVRFIMIDTKMIELGVYADIPHLLVPVVTEAKKASAALKWAVREMEGRYRKLAAVGVRNITQFNELLQREPKRTMPDPKTETPVTLEQLPYIVIVIDELADLMMVSSADVEESIMRLAQMARAVGIHLIIATQRPSVDVITGTIKANFPSRIAFRVSQRVDSRTIIDQQGAEHLLGRGDMLFLKTGSSRLIRVHGGLITETEISRITTFLKKMAPPVYDETILRDTDEEGDPLEAGERDEMYARAVRCVVQEGKCSVTLIQRRLQLGYARAARIVDMMERDGVVSAGEGSKPREILVGSDYLEGLGPA